MTTRNLAIAGSIAALSLAAAPIAAVAAAPSHSTKPLLHVDRSRDARSGRHVDRQSSVDRKSSLDRSRDR